MRLVVPFPPEWQVESGDGWVCATVPGHAAAPDLVVYVTDVRGLPPVVDAAFLTAQLRLATPAGAAVHIVDTRDDVSAKRWPITTVRATVQTAGVIVEQRLACFYRLLDQFAAVIVVGRDPERWQKLVAGLGEIVLAADVDWAGPPASLAEILGIDADHAVFRG